MCLVNSGGSWHEKLMLLVTHFSLPVLAFPFQGHWKTASFPQASLTRSLARCLGERPGMLRPLSVHRSRMCALTWGIVVCVSCCYVYYVCVCLLLCMCLFVISFHWLIWLEESIMQEEGDLWMWRASHGKHAQRDVGIRQMCTVWKVAIGCDAEATY